MYFGDMSPAPNNSKYIICKIIFYLNCIFYFVYLFLLSYFKIIIWGNGYHDPILLHFVYADLISPNLSEPSFSAPHSFRSLQSLFMIHTVHYPLSTLHKISFLFSGSVSLIVSWFKHTSTCTHIHKQTLESRVCICNKTFSVRLSDHRLLHLRISTCILFLETSMASFL